MRRFGIDIEVQCVPPLDTDFIPMAQFDRAFLRTARHALTVVVERADGQRALKCTRIHGTEQMREADNYYIDRLVKNLLWTKGGFRIYTDDKLAYDYLKNAYCVGGSRAFDAQFMSEVYERPFEVIWTDVMPQEKHTSQAVGGHWEGCRIGFDAGGSDRKVSAVKDGAVVFSEEVVWFPKEHADPAYHYEGIVSALQSAAAHLPRVDAVGISSAGVFVNDRTMVSSLFRKVPRAEYDRRVKNIYLRAVHDTFGDIPCRVVNDGDVSALCGAMSLQEKNILGIAMGTSEAAGFVDGDGCITGWLNELAFAPVDAAGGAAVDEWSGDRGCGGSYFSQEAVIRLAQRADVVWAENLPPAEKLKTVQSLMAQDDPRAVQVYESIGVYLGHTLAYYAESYACRYVLLLGRVMSGKGGDLIVKTAKDVLQREYPALADTIQPVLPDENFRRVGQAVAAASLPK